MPNTIQLTLEVDDKGSAKIKQFGSTLTGQVKKASESAAQSAGAVGQVETAYSKLQAGVAGFFTKMQSHWVAFTAATVAVGMAISKALEYITLGGAAIKAEESFRAMADSANVNADSMLESMKKAADGFVDDSHLMQKASFAMAQEIDPNQIPALFEAARLAARKTGADVTSSIDSMIQGIATNMPRGLRQMGAITKEQMGILDAAMKAGVTEVNLTSLVLANAAVDAAKLGASANNAAKDIDRLKVAAEELKEIAGKAEISILGGLMGVLKGVAALALEGAAGVFKLIEATERLAAFGADKVGMSGVAKTLRADADRWKAEAAAATSAAADLAQKAHDAIFGSVDKADTRSAAQKKADIDAAESARSAVEATMKAGIEKQKLIEQQRTADMQSLKKWQDMKDTVGLQGYEKDLAQLNNEYAAVKRVSDGKLDIERIYQLQKTELVRANALKVAEEDKKSLESRLADAQTFYGSLQGMIQKNVEDQKRGVAELNALYKQMADAQKSSASLIGSLQQIGMSPTEKYQAQKSALYDQGMAAMRQSGQEQVKALEEYKQALASFGQTWSAGVTEISKNVLFGDQTSIIANGKDVIASVISDITAATDAQSRALASLAEEKQKEIEANKTWGDTLVQTAKEWAAEIDKLKGVIGELDAQIKAMQKTITMTGVDEVSVVVDTIARNLAALHDKTVYITTIQRTVSEGNSGSGASVGAPLTIADFSLPEFKQPDFNPSPTSYAQGTNYVPRTGLYRLHEGEIVVPLDLSAQIRGKSVLRGVAGSDDEGDAVASPGSDPGLMMRESVAFRPPVESAPRQANMSSITDSRSFKIGDIHIHIPESAAPQRPEDWRAITREYIVPELRKIAHA